MISAIKKSIGQETMRLAGLMINVKELRDIKTRQRRDLDHIGSR